HDDELGVVAVQPLPVETQLAASPCREVHDHGVGVGEEHGQRGTPLLPGEIEPDAALAGVVLAEVDAAEAGVAERAGRVAGERLDLDHVGSEVCEHLGARRPGDVLAEVDDAATSEGARRHRAAAALSRRMSADERYRLSPKASRIERML